eukprot:scaffold694_cov338-Pavlova_lutheri.AAC.3
MRGRVRQVADLVLVHLTIASGATTHIMYVGSAGLSLRYAKNAQCNGAVLHMTKRRRERLQGGAPAMLVALALRIVGAFRTRLICRTMVTKTER